MISAPSGLEIEYMYSTPLISEILRSNGLVSCSSTILAEAPGKGSRDVGHGNNDLRLFFARRGDDRKQAQ